MKSEAEVRAGVETLLAAMDASIRLKQKENALWLAQLYDVLNWVVGESPSFDALLGDINRVIEKSRRMQSAQKT